MTELMSNGWNGWLRYTDDGKYGALLLLAVLFLWFRREEEKEKLLLLYATVLVVCCIFPVSAAALMLYQTRFYDYEWIWNYVPVTLMIAYGGTVFLCKYLELYKSSLWKRAGLWLGTVAVIFLCGSMGQTVFEEATDMQERAEAQQVLAEVLAETGREDICLWAPRAVMESARAYNGHIRLVYGRNIWDAALGAYSYEMYGEAEEALCHWMTRIEASSMKGHFANEPTSEEIVEGGAACIRAAAALGVDTVLLPGKILPEDMQRLEEVTRITPIQVGEYFLLKLAD